MKKTTLAVLLLTALHCFAQTEQPLLLRKPTISKSQIAFVYAGDLWIVGRDGGEAKRLTTSIGSETDPQFSPDGSMIAFTGEYDGNVDVYTIPATGGEPKRMTFHPNNDSVQGWTNDGKQILFISNRGFNAGGTSQLFTLPLTGGLPQAIPLPMAYDGAYSPDGSRIAYEPLPRAFAAWKRYRGGRTSAIWLASLSDSSVEKVPRNNSNDFEPMWPNFDKAGKVYYLSDRNGAVTLFSYDTTTKKVNQELANNGLDIKSAAATSDAIVYEQFGSLNLFDVKTGQSKKLKITVAGDQMAVRSRFEKVGNQLRNAALSPTGVRAVFETRGEIVSVPAEKGSPRNLTNSSGVAERDPAWSPNGKWIAYFSDESGEYALHLKDQMGVGEVKKIKLEPSFYYSPVWSPDSKKIAYTDKRLNLWVVDIEKGIPQKIDSSKRGNQFNQKWSPDSQWITYNKPLPSWYNAVFVYSVEQNKSTQITDGLSDARYPVFDQNGKQLYFTASTDIGPKVFGFDMTSYPHRPTRSVYVAVLKKTDPSPLAPESDEEKLPDEEKTPEATASKAFDAASGAKAKAKALQVTIDFDNINQRILVLPIPAKNFAGLQAGKSNSIYIEERDPDSGGAAIHKFDLTKRKLDKVLDNVNAFIISANGEKMMYAQGTNAFIVPTAAPVKPGEGRLNLDAMEMQIDPRAEWTQMYAEVWRIERDFFYDANHHGLDLKATEKKYEPYLQTLQHRSDLNYLFQEMLGELTIGHLYVNGGDVPDPKRVPGGLLGCDYKIENGRYRFAKVFNGENWNPSLRAPLTQPGVNVVAGEYLLTINGRNLTANDNVYQALESTANKQVIIRVGPNADGSSSREVTVIPVAAEGSLRNFAWIEGNRRKVSELSGGKLAYVYVPNTAQDGYTYFNRYYFSQLDKDGAVIDERFNGGGSAADYMIEYLKKPIYSYWAVRDGEDWRQPFGAMQGPKAMLVNEFAGSGGDYLPWMFRREKIGTLIGKRTWGGLVGIGGYPQLIDGGSVTAPHFAFYSPEGKWEVENYGVAPDIEIDLDPKAWKAGRDVQLEKAVEVLMAAMAKNPIKKTPRPAYPNYHNPSSAAKPAVAPNAKVAEKPIKSEGKSKPTDKSKVVEKDAKTKANDKVATK